MIECFSLTNAYLLGDVISSMHRLRYKEFVERLEYNVPCHDSMEYDQYDTLAAVHFVWRDNFGKVGASLRISPTTKPYMIKDIWPYTVENMELPSSDDVWEATRLCVDKNLPKDMHYNIHAQLLCALQEYALSNKISSYIGIAPPGLWKYTFIRFGWPIHFLGGSHKIEYKENIRAGLMEVSEEILQNIRSINNITGNVLKVTPQSQIIKNVA
ncbi:MAG: GNAT family N-acetyltransferase [Proteobacteria bacterium]|nr:GNAT family N-acetyltransferase [Pseudomonadota bacterium]